MRYRTHKDHILRVAGQRVTDDLAGVELPDTPAVREHVRLGRLLRVQAEKKPKNRKQTEVAAK